MTWRKVKQFLFAMNVEMSLVNGWNSFFEQKVVESKNSSLKQKDLKSNMPQKLNSYEAKETIRTSTGFGELDNVLGGGLVKGSLVLLRGRAWNW